MSPIDILWIQGGNATIGSLNNILLFKKEMFHLKIFEYLFNPKMHIYIVINYQEAN